MSIAITDDSFKKDVLESDSPVLVDFWAPWCGPCRMLGPILDELSTDMTGTIKIVKMNIDENPNIPSEFGIRSIPTMILFKNGAQCGTKVGVLEKEAIKEWIKSNI